jgi:hypothetical protein
MSFWLTAWTSRLVMRKHGFFEDGLAQKPTQSSAPSLPEVLIPPPVGWLTCLSDNIYIVLLSAMAFRKGHIILIGRLQNTSRCVTGMSIFVASAPALAARFSAQSTQSQHLRLRQDGSQLCVFIRSAGPPHASIAASSTLERCVLVAHLTRRNKNPVLIGTADVSENIKQNEAAQCTCSKCLWI